MGINKIHCPNRLFLLAFVIFIHVFSGNSISYGQDIKSRRDSISLNESYFIQRVFQYHISGGDTVRDGAYRLILKPAFQDTLLSESYRFSRLEANFNNNRKAGPFSLNSIAFRPEFSRLELDTAFLQIPYSGTVAQNRGQFAGGQPTGPWSFRQFQQDIGSPSDTLFLVNTFFNQQGLPDRQFSIIDREAREIIRGEFDHEGHFNGAISVRDSREDDRIIISYLYENGLLVGINRAGERILQPDFAVNQEGVSFQSHSLDSLYIRVLGIFLEESSADEKESLLEPIHKILESFNLVSGNYSPLMAYLPGGQDIPYPLVKIPVYETAPGASAIITETRSSISSLENGLDSLLAIPSFQVNRYASRELATLYATGLVLQERVNQLMDISKNLSGPIAEHIPKERYLGRRLDEINPLDTASYTFHDSLYEEPLDFSFDRETLPPYTQYQTYVSKLESFFSNIRAQSDQLIARFRQDTLQQEQVERISTLSTAIDRLADTLELNLYDPAISRSYKQAFVEFKEQLLDRYANMEPPQRIDFADSMLSCLEELRSRLRNASRLSLKAQEVDRTYTDYRLNPYTYTEMKVRLFEKLYNAYREKLVPFLVQRITPADSCDEFLRKAANIEKLQDYMLNAVGERPRRLERRIRPEDSPETIIRKLDIPLVLN